MKYTRIFIFILSSVLYSQQLKIETDYGNITGKNIVFINETRISVNTLFNGQIDIPIESINKIWYGRDRTLNCVFGAFGAMLSLKLFKDGLQLSVNGQIHDYFGDNTNNQDIAKSNTILAASIGVGFFSILFQFYPIYRDTFSCESMTVNEKRDEIQTIFFENGAPRLRATSSP